MTLQHLLYVAVGCVAAGSTPQRQAQLALEAWPPVTAAAASTFPLISAAPQNRSGPASLVQRWRSVELAALEHAQHWEHSSWAAELRALEERAVQAGLIVLNSPSVPPDNEYDLFRKEDLNSWILFFVIFVVLLVFDNAVLNGKEDEPLSFQRACFYSVFWLLCAAGFNVYVYHARGLDDAVNWGTGYLLEWMLSVDNLFVFRSIFLTFRTPDAQKHKPLFWGIIGAIVFRMIFFVLGEILLHSFSFMYVLLGAFLVYTGVKIMLVKEDEEMDPESDPLLKKITERLPYVNRYAPTPLFFARISEHRVPSDFPSGADFDSDVRAARTASGDMSRTLDSMGNMHSTADTKVVTRFDETKPLRATKLLLVVICLELTDVVFAVDSVSAIVAQIPDLFLAYTACVFAMLGLRATFFVIEELVKLFTLLSYGVALILIFIGLKLMLRGYVHIPHQVVCAILVSTLVLSILASYVYEKYIKQEDDEEEIDKIKGDAERGLGTTSKLGAISERESDDVPPEVTGTVAK